MNDYLWDTYGVKMATSSLYRMKAYAMKLIQGGHDESYTNLPMYCHLLKTNNPGSIAFCTWRILHQPQKCLQFTSIFISFEAQFKGVIEGFKNMSSFSKW